MDDLGAQADAVRLLPGFTINTLLRWQVTSEDVRTSRTLRAVHDALFAALKGALG